MTKWEYKVVDITRTQKAVEFKMFKLGKLPKTPSIQEVLNAFGAEGWELLTIHTSLLGTYMAYFKRPIME